MPLSLSSFTTQYMQGKKEAPMLQDASREQESLSEQTEATTFLAEEAFGVGADQEVPSGLYWRTFLPALSLVSN
jgi:hypothetical protein